METEKCAALLTVLQCGSLKAAADRLGYTVSGISRMMAAMEDENYFRDTVGKICATRADTMTKLRERGFTGPDSATNFLFVTTSRMPCKQIFERLRQKGVLIRYFSAPRLSDYLRITIGTPEQMQRFFEELDLILGNTA